MGLFLQMKIRYVISEEPKTLHTIPLHIVESGIVYEYMDEEIFCVLKKNIIVETE